MIYGYGRHSTDGQCLTEAAQRKAVEAYARAFLDADSLDEWLYDAAVSRSRPMFERPEGLRLWALAQPGDHIVVAKLDRAFGKTVDGLRTMEMLEHKGVYFHCVNPKVDTHTAMGRAIVSVLLAFSQLDREQTAERTRDALAVKREAGLPYGSSVPIGWKKIGSGKSGRFVPDEAERDQVRLMWHMHRSGMSYDKVVAAMRPQRRPNGKEWNRNTVRAAITAAQEDFPKVRPASRPRGAA
jgi:DNA invertase Pin-like site-specific DNA recombinase